MAGGRVVPIEYDLPFDEMKARCAAALPAGGCLPAAHSEELAGGEGGGGDSAMDLAQLHPSDSTWELPATVRRCCTREAATSSLSGTVASCWQVLRLYFAQEAEIQREDVLQCLPGAAARMHARRQDMRSLLCALLRDRPASNVA